MRDGGKRGAVCRQEEEGGGDIRAINNQPGEMGGVEYVSH